MQDVEAAFVSSLTWAELALEVHAVTSLAEYKRRTARVNRLRAMFGEGLPFDDHCAQAYDAALEHVTERGGSPKAHRFDRMIAATAAANGLALVTRNSGDFLQLRGLVEVVER